MSNILSMNGFDIIDADKISREIMDTDKTLQKSIIKEFGQEIVDEAGNIDRTKLGNLIFANP